MLRIGSIVLNVHDMDRASGFWSRALGYTAPPAHPAFLRDESGTGPRLHLDSDDRTHLDLWVSNDEEQATEVERLIGLGARRVDWDYPEDADFVVLADPEGNLFCIVNAGTDPAEVS